MTMIEMVRGDETCRELFDLHPSAWIEWLALAELHGWAPQGTKPNDRDRHLPPGYSEWFTPDYKPATWGYSKLVTANDARGIAFALSAYLMTDLSVHPVARRQMNEFIEFLRGGEFIFALWD